MVQFQMFPSKKIIILEDEEVVVTFLEKVLNFIQENYVIVNEGSQVLETVKKSLERNEPFDIALLDLNVKEGMGGVETNRYLKEIQPTIYSILMSGSPVDDAMVNYTKYGFQATLKKPFTIDQLLHLLKQVK